MWSFGSVGRREKGVDCAIVSIVMVVVAFEKGILFLCSPHLRCIRIKQNAADFMASRKGRTEDEMVRRQFVLSKIDNHHPYVVVSRRSQNRRGGNRYLSNDFEDILSLSDSSFILPLQISPCDLSI